ncbi:MAG TPA: hypothetical protein VKQ70_17020 [Caulobacteraceae bacterium]|nr:hypothetical protein [Caulobacteraceae bacterium]
MLVTIGMIEHVALTSFGAFMLQISVRNRGRQPLSLLRALRVEDNGRPMTILSDMAVSSILSGVLVFAISRPGSVAQAVVAGLGASSVLDALGREHSANANAEGSAGT